VVTNTTVQMNTTHLVVYRLALELSLVTVKIPLRSLQVCTAVKVTTLTPQQATFAHCALKDTTVLTLPSSTHVLPAKIANKAPQLTPSHAPLGTVVINTLMLCVQRAPTSTLQRIHVSIAQLDMCAQAGMRLIILLSTLGTSPL
jgi:hypothetical protein